MNSSLLRLIFGIVPKILLTAVASIFVSSAAIAANTWDGGGADDNWSSLANWNSDTAPNYATVLTYGNSTRFTSNNNGATSSIAGITFSSAATTAYTITGSSVTLSGNIANNSATVHTVNLPLVLDANRTIATNSGGITLGGQISGAFTLIQSGIGGILTLNTAGSSFNLFQINSGTAKLGVNDALPTTKGVTFANVGNPGTLDLNGKTQTLGAAITFAGTNATATQTITDTAGGGLLKLGGNVTHNATSSPNVTISAALDLNAATRTFNLNRSDASFTVSGVISNSSGTAGLTKAGVGTLTLNNANTYNGDTTVSAGTLALGSAGSLASTSLLVQQGALFDASAVSGGFGLAGRAFTANITDVTPAASYTLVNLTGHSGDFSTVSLTGNFTGSLSLTAANTWTGAIGGYDWSFSESLGTLTATAVPEPSTYAALAGLGALGFMAWRRRRFPRDHGDAMGCL